MLSMQASVTVEAYHHGDNLLLFQSLSNKLYVLNDTGRCIWEELACNSDTACVAKELASRYSVSFNQALHDVRTCLQQWQEIGLFSKPEDVPPLEAQPYPFLTEEVESYLPENGRYFPLKDTFILAGQIMEVNYGESAFQHWFRNHFPHLLIHEDRTPDLSVNLWKKKGEICAEIGGKMMRATDSLDRILSWIVAEFVDKSYRNRDCLAVLHAGAVGFQGKGVILAGRSGSGKSTLNTALQSDGFSYLCDDVCPLDSTSGKLIPVPMSQSIKKGSWQILAEFHPSLASQNSIYAKEKVIKYISPLYGNKPDWEKNWQVDMLLFPQYVPNASTEISSLTPVDALSVLINSGSLCGASIGGFLNWIETRRCYAVTYSSLREVKAEIKQQLLR